MKHLLPYLFGPVCLLFALTGCTKKNCGISGKGAAGSEQRYVAPFERVVLNCDAEVLYTQDSIYRVEVRGQENIRAVLDCESTSGSLRIAFRKPVRRHDGLRVVLHSPNIKEFNLSGSGSITSTGTISTTSLLLSVSGSGQVQLPWLNCSTVDARVSGSGNIHLAGGSCTAEVLSVSGSGNLRCLGLSANKAQCRTSGSGDIEVHALDELDVSISGSGNVRYSGRPRVTSSISGSGTLLSL